MSYKLVIFDMDGTILDTLKDLANSVNYALECEGLPVRSFEYVRSIVGHGIFITLKLCAPEGTDDEMIEKLYKAFAPHYETHRADNTKPYDGIRPLLEKLRNDGIKTAVVSNKSDVSVKPLSVQYFDDLFDMSLGTHPGIEKKPAPDMPNAVISHFGFDKSEVVYVGDSEVDIMTAKNTGIDGIFVDWGFRGAERLKNDGAEVIVSDTDTLYRLITE